MIDHVSLQVRDLAKAAAFYEALLAPLGYRRLVQRKGQVGFGKRYPEIWLNARPDEPQAGPRSAAMTSYFGAFIRDLDGNRVEAASFPRPDEDQGPEIAA